MTKPAVQKRVSRWGLFVPIIILALLIAGWTAYWFVVRGKFTETIDQWIAAERAAGTSIDYQSRNVGGYPFRVALDVEKPDFKKTDGSAWQGENFQLVLQPWNPSHIMFRAPGLNQWTDASGIRHTFQLDAKSAGSVTSENGEMKRLAVTLNKGSLLLNGHPYDVDGLTLNFAPNPAAKDNLMIAADWRAIKTERTPPAFPYLGDTLGESRIIAEVEGFYPALKRTGGLVGGVWDELHHGGGKLMIGQGLLSWGPMKIGTKGDLIFAEAGTNGVLSVRLEDSEGLIAAMKESGNWGILEQIMVTPLQSASQEGGFLDLDVVNSEARLAGQKIFSLPKPKPGA